MRAETARDDETTTLQTHAQGDQAMTTTSLETMKANLASLEAYRASLQSEARRTVDAKSRNDRLAEIDRVNNQISRLLDRMDALDTPVYTVACKAIKLACVEATEHDAQSTAFMMACKYNRPITITENATMVSWDVYPE